METEEYNQCFMWFEEYKNVLDDINKLNLGNTSKLDIVVKLPPARFARLTNYLLYIQENFNTKFSSVFIMENEADKVEIEYTESILSFCARCKRAREDAKVRPWIDPEDLLCFRCDEAILDWIKRGNKLSTLPQKK